MADIPAATWSETDASNNSASPEGAPESMAPSGLNNTMRMMMGAIKRAYVWSNIPTTTGGTTTAYTLSYSVAPTALVDGMSHLVLFNATCGATPTLNISSLGAKPLHYYTGSAWAAVPAGLIVANMICAVTYNSGAGTYRIWSFPSSIGTATLAGDQTFTGANTFSGTVTMSAKALNEAVRVDVASATTCDIGAAASNYVRITGTTTITGLGTIASGARRHVVFGGALTLTYDATALILPTGASITTAAGDTALFMSEGSGNWRCLSYQRVSGRALTAYSVLQVVSTFDGVYATTAGTGIPVDNTIPQNTEGDQILSLAITPQSATSKLIIEVSAVVARGNTDHVAMALFQDSTANALAVVSNPDVGSTPTTMDLRLVMTSGTTSSTTFKVRVGSETPAALYFNGTSGGALFGGKYASNITITEFLA